MQMHRKTGLAQNLLYINANLLFCIFRRFLIMNDKIQLKQDGRFFFGWWIVFLGFCLMLLAYVGFASLTSVFVIPVTEALGVGRGEWMLYMTI